MSLCSILILEVVTMFDNALSYQSALDQNPDMDTWNGIPVPILNKLFSEGWNPLAVSKTIWDDGKSTGGECRYYVDLIIEHNETLELDSIVILDFQEKYDHLDILQRINEAVDQFIHDKNNLEPF